MHDFNFIVTSLLFDIFFSHDSHILICESLFAKEGIIGILSKFFNIQNHLTLIELSYYVLYQNLLIKNEFIDKNTKIWFKEIIFVRENKSEKFSYKLKELQMTRVDPRLSIEKIIIFTSFHEKTIVDIEHGLTY